jgi:hypothetical protein
VKLKWGWGLGCQGLRGRLLQVSLTGLGVFHPPLASWLMHTAPTLTKHLLHCSTAHAAARYRMTQVSRSQHWVCLMVSCCLWRMTWSAKSSQ